MSYGRASTRSTDEREASLQPVSLAHECQGSTLGDVLTSASHSYTPQVSFSLGVLSLLLNS